MDLTPDQIARLQNLGITTDHQPQTPPSTPVISDSNPTPFGALVSTSKPIPTTQEPSPKPLLTNQIQANDINLDLNNTDNIGNNQVQTISSNQSDTLLTQQEKPNNSNKNVIPLLSISGFTLISLSGLLIFKSKDSTASVSSPPPPSSSASSQVSPTQVPKSIQHYLLTSQQFFTQAVSTQNQDQNQTVELLNQSLLTATSAISDFPDDYRGYEQRGRIYQSLTGSQPQLLDQAISDLSAALRLNPNSPELNRQIASLYAQKGDPTRTLFYLTQTIALEPTKADNFYDLARVQQQSGLIPQALESYNRLLTLITDPAQQAQIKSEALALENLVKQSGQTAAAQVTPTLAPEPSLSLPESPLLQAENFSPSTGPIIAAPEDAKNIAVTGQSESNSLSGSSSIPSGQTQITLQNENLTSTSQVYVSSLSGPQNINLQLVSKSGTSFTVGIDSPVSESVNFKWWIINP